MKRRPIFLTRAECLRTAWVLLVFLACVATCFFVGEP
jgi:hypothetical protein